MKSTLIKSGLGLLALGLFATTAQANWGQGLPGHPLAHTQHYAALQQTRVYTQQFNARQDRQMARIRAGFREGLLSRAEYRRLMHEQGDIRAMENRFRADGVIDAREFRRLERALDVASRKIRSEMHERQARNAYGHPTRFN